VAISDTEPTGSQTQLEKTMAKSKIKLDKELIDRVKKYADIAGYSSAEEFITHVLEVELGKLEGSDSEEEIKKRLQGLGYL